MKRIAIAMETRRAHTHRSLDRGLRAIEATAAIGGSATLGEIARKIALPRSTTHHLLRALVEIGYLAQDGDGRPYRLTPKLFQLTGRTWSKEQLAEIAMPFLDDLSQQTGEGTSLAILQDGVVWIVAKRESDGPVRVVQEVGARRPIYCTAVGKALAAWLAGPELEGIIARTAFTPYTPRTITTPAAFRREMAHIRAAGFAIDNEEHQPAIRCIATPVRDHTGEVRASLCVVGPTSRVPQRRLAEIRRPLADVAAALSARLGYGTDGRATGAEQPRSTARLQQDTMQKGGISHTLPERTRTGRVLRKGEAQ
jgi:DNA-binding IclR family transcriptional regulator